MRFIISKIISTNIYNKLSPSVRRAIFKIFKIFFVETDLQSLPESNHPLNLNFDEELNKFNTFNRSKNIPFISYSHLADLIKIYSNLNKKNKLNLLDFGAGNLELYSFLNSKIKKVNYFYYDQLDYRKIMLRIKKSKKLKNFNILDDRLFKMNSYDIVYFGGSLQYINSYKIEMKKVFNKSKYIIIAQTPFFSHSKIKRDVILKQVNLSKEINHLYLINIENFLRFMQKNNYHLISKNYNRVIKFLNFKNLKRKFKNIDMYDLVFEKK